MSNEGEMRMDEIVSRKKERENEWMKERRGKGWRCKLRCSCKEAEAKREGKKRN